LVQENHTIADFFKKFCAGSGMPTRLADLPAEGDIGFCLTSLERPLESSAKGP
jgi:hypothetical protein